MKSCDIHIRSIDPGELGGVGLACSIKLMEADIADKLMVMHTLAMNLHLDKMDLIMYVQAEIADVFDKCIIAKSGGSNRES